MHLLADIYHPITAVPFQNDESYCEVAPCEALKPYIRCFWGTKNPVGGTENSSNGLIIPDTCMDLIFRIDYTHNRYCGTFCAIDEHSYRLDSAANTSLTATFAIRFYAWSAVLFSEDDFRGSKNKAFSASMFFGKLQSDLEPLLLGVPSLHGKIELTQKFLLKRLNENRINANLFNSIYYMIKTCGRERITDVCCYSSVSEKQLERIFIYNTGITPKTLSSLIRYQLLWQDMILHKHFHALDAVDKYGYTDQAHLLNDFKKRHLMNPKQAVEFANKYR